MRAAGSSACLDHGPVAVPRPRCGSPARAPQGDPRGLRASSPPPTRDRGAGPCLPGVLVAPKARPAQPGPRQRVWWAGAGETWKCPRGEARGGTPGQGVRGPRRALGAPSPCGLCPRDPEAPEAVAAPRPGPLRPPCWAASSAAGRSQRPAGSKRSAPWSRATTSACCPWARPLGSPPAPQTLRLLSPHGLTLTSDPSHRLVPGTDPSATLPRPGGSTLQ